MKLSLFYFTYYLFILLSTAAQTEFNTNSCPTSRRLLFLGGFNFPLGEKKSEHISSSSKASSTPSKHSRHDTPATSHGLTVYIQPQTSSELGHKVRSYTYLLKSKLFTKAERAKLKKVKSEKKKAEKIKKKNTTTTQHATKSRELVAVDDQERDRCRALLHIGHQNSLIPAKKSTKKPQKEKDPVTSKVKDITKQAKKKVTDVAEKALPKQEKQKAKKVKPEKINTKSTSKEKKKKSSETQPLTPPPVNEVPVKKQTTTTTPRPPRPPPPQSSPPPPPPKSKREKPPPVIIEPTEASQADEADEIENEEKNNSVVGRAYYFVKNMFQLSDDILDNNHTHEEDDILSSVNEQQHRPSRKLLSIHNDYEFQFYLNQFHAKQSFIPSDDLSYSAVSLSKRQLLTVKTNKRPTVSKEKKTTSDKNKPKVGWAYRYRISRYLDDQKPKRPGHGNRVIGGGKSKHNQQSDSKQINKKISSSSNTKISKRKLLELDFDDESSSNEYDISNQDIVDTVTITQAFVPKRQLLSTKKVEKIVKHEEETDDEDNIDKHSERRRLKSYEELTDPVEIVRSYDRGLFKPRVGWQFRYRVSRYIDSLRENIREDQERLKLGLQAIKRKTPQELSGRRKRVLDKPFEPELTETPVVTEENKPNVGWRYRYRISKMLEAKQRGEYIDDEEEKRKARLEQKRKPHGHAKSADEDEECVEWEHDLDPELRKISEEGKRVGWAYRYRIRRKLDELKQRQAETGKSFDLETLGGGGKREKKTVPTTTSSTVVTEEKSAEVEKKAVGWQYRYRVSKMREAQKLEGGRASGKSTGKKHEQVPTHEGLDPVLARLAPEERVVGWQYRYRIRRKLDAIKNATRETDGGKRGKKQKQKQTSSSKQKDKEQIIKKVEESIEKILNIDDIEETPFMEYFRRTSSYILFGLAPPARKSICLLPLPVTLSFCRDDYDETQDVKPTITTTPTSKQTPPKKLKTKKEKRAKQFIHSRPTKLDTVDEKTEEPVKPVSKAPTPTIEKPHKKQSTPRARPPVRRDVNEQTKHFNEEEHPVKKLVGVEAKKKKNKKRFQIIGQEVKIKHKHTNTPSTTTSPPVTTTTHSVPVTTTNPPPIVTTSPPIVETPKTTPAPPPPPSTTARPPPASSPPSVSRPPPPTTPQPKVVPTTTTTHTPLQTISEIVQEEAATLLTTQSTFIDEAKEEVNEKNEILKSTSSADVNNDDDDDSGTASSDEEENGSSSSDSESGSSDSDDDDDSNEKTEEKDENFDPLAMKKMKKLYENAKESVHGVFDLKDEQDSS